MVLSICSSPSSVRFRAEAQLRTNYKYLTGLNRTRLSEGKKKLNLFNCKGFEQLLPLPIIWRDYRQSWLDDLPEGIKTALNLLTGKGELDSWEIMVSRQLPQTDYWRINLTNPRSLDAASQRAQPCFSTSVTLPSLLDLIESGDFPPRQAGFYELISDLWF